MTDPDADATTGTHDLAGRRVLITGASSGIGAATARTLAGRGARVALLARSRDALEELAGELDGAVAVPADVTDVDGVHAAVDRAAEELGGLDGLVNGAGVVDLGTIGGTDPRRWRPIFEVNVLGLLNVTHAAVPHLREAGSANLVNVSSMSGRRMPRPELAVYSGSKFAVHTISKGLREELQSDGIRVTILSPGFVVTDIHTGIGDDDDRDAFAEAMRSKGLTPEVVADQVAHVLAAPPEATIFEVALLSTGQ